MHNMGFRLETYDARTHDGPLVASLIYSADEEMNALVYGNREEGERAIARLMQIESNYYSASRLFVAMDEGEVVGVVAGFPVSEKSAIDQASGKASMRAFGPWTFLRRMPTFMRMNKLVWDGMDADGWYVHTLAVHEAHRRQGFGRQIVEALAEQHGKLYLDVNATNDRALAFYRSMGFEVQSENRATIKGREYGTYSVRRG
jgi:GNAT superfamily N-acetyltransferase